MKRALVLGGGGVVGTAWETGLVEGLAQAGIDLREADLIVGTSAGSIVGTRLAAGHDLSQAVTPADEEETPIVPLPEGGIDLPVVGRLFALWNGTETMTDERGAEIGALALASRTVEEELWVTAIKRSVGVPDWPETPLKVTAVDAETGEFRAHSQSHGLDLNRCIAASCSVPGLFPPITFGERRWMDGGVRSGTSADLALEHAPDSVLVIAPICARTAGFGALAERCMAAEITLLREAGAEVCGVLPGDADIEAFGPNLMDPTFVESAREAGRRRGEALAAAEAAIWLS